MPNQTGTFLGFDYGSKHIGVAVGQRITGTASPLETVRVSGNNPDWDAIARLIATWRPEGLVVGVAYQPDGTDNPITQPMLRFSRQLHARYGLPVHTVDETLTTADARHMLYNDLKVRRKTYLQAKDELAAQLILQTWLTL
ncbi:MAG: Holliday junction resolvase RuvX [Methylococcaceae bacterium]|nr:MAG: Holliday junction resolvase RuvX [Methylococcaceae bacterium]